MGSLSAWRPPLGLSPEVSPSSDSSLPPRSGLPRRTVHARPATPTVFPETGDVMKAIPIAFFGLILTAGTATAQHEGHHPAATPTPPPATTPITMPPAAATSPPSAATPAAPSAPSNP